MKDGRGWEPLAVTGRRSGVRYLQATVRVLVGLTSHPPCGGSSLATAFYEMYSHPLKGELKETPQKEIITELNFGTRPDSGSLQPSRVRV